MLDVSPAEVAKLALPWLEGLLWAMLLVGIFALLFGARIARAEQRDATTEHGTRGHADRPQNPDGPQWRMR